MSNPGIIRHHKNRVRDKSQWRDGEDIKSRQHEALDRSDAGKVNLAKVCAELEAERKPTANSIFRISLAEKVVTRVRLDCLIFMEARLAGFNVSPQRAGRPSGFMAVSTSKRPIANGTSRTRRFTRENSFPTTATVPSLTSAPARPRPEKICWVSHGRAKNKK